MNVGRRVMITAAVVGIVALAVLAVLVIVGFTTTTLFFRAYLLGYQYWLGLSLGSLGIVVVQFLTGGRWGLATRRIFEAGIATLPMMAVLFVPLLLGLQPLYAWARPDVVAADPVLQHKSIYLNIPFFVIRALVYLVCWVVLGYLMRRWSLRQDRTDDPAVLVRLQRLSIVAALVLSFTVTLAAIDWLMSLEPDWFSTMYPPMIAMGDLLLALAFGVVIVAVFGPRSALGEILTPNLFNDLGSLLLAFTMLWGYLEFFQYMLIWAGNLSDEIPWYVSRSQGGWQPLAITVGAVAFFLPWYLLLFRPLKRNPRTLAAIALLLVCMQVVSVFWMVAPPFEPDGPAVSLLDVLAVVGFGGLWLAVFAWQLGARPLLPAYDPRVQPALEAAHESA
ncbi:MAG: hypothetical protein JOZ81_12645 [Chloroflexi bacterium]|nr:hypothetical protein [Chloroflexota bacterium]